MPKTTQLTVGPTTPVAITIRSTGYVSKVTLRENRDVAGWPTTSWKLSGPVWDPANAKAFAPGEAKEMSLGAPLVPRVGTYSPNQTIAQILTDAGTTTFDQDEEP